MVLPHRPRSPTTQKKVRAIQQTLQKRPLFWRLARMHCIHALLKLAQQCYQVRGYRNNVQKKWKTVHLLFWQVQAAQAQSCRVICANCKVSNNLWASFMLWLRRLAAQKLNKQTHKKLQHIRLLLAWQAQISGLEAHRTLLWQKVWAV